MKRIPNKKDWLLGLIPLIILFCCYIYSDIILTTTRGIVFWECIFNDVHDSIFTYVYRAVPNSMIPNGCIAADYDFFFYIFFAIFDFPLWIFEKATGLSFVSYWITRLYAKSIILVFLFWSSCVFKKIVTRFTDETLATWSQYFYIISISVAHVIVVIGNYDIIAVTFILIGTYYYLCEDDRKFVLFFAIAATCKMFALFVFVPLVLLRYKRVRDIIARVILSISLIIIPKIIYVFYDKLVLSRDAFNSNKLNIVGTDSANVVGNRIIAHSGMIDIKLFSGIGAPLSMDYIPLFIIVTLLLWWLCWKNNSASEKDCIVYSSMGIFAFFLFCDTIPYWSILLLPYIVFFMITNYSRITENAFLESVMMLSYIIYNNLTRLHIYQGKLLLDMIPLYRVKESIIDNYGEPGFYLLIQRLSKAIGISYDHIAATFLGIFALALLIFWVTNILHKEETEYDFETIRKVAYSRMAIAIIVAMLPFITMACRFVNGRM